MDKTEINEYALKQKISDINGISAYEAVSKESGERIFLKIINNKQLLAIIQKSVKLHNRIHYNNLLTLNRVKSAKNALFVEYDFLSDELWQPVTFEFLFSDFEKNILEIALIVDYLHLQKIVHNDLKLSNFLYNKKTGKIKLTDLDFLSENNSPTNSLIMGTARFIAPEILADEAFTVYSDNYSLGKSLAFGLERFKNELNQRKQLEVFITKLTSEYSYDRPQFLIDGLHNCKLINTESYNSYQKKLLALNLVTSFKNLTIENRKKKSSLLKILSAENYIIGLPREVIESLIVSFLDNRQQALTGLKYLFNNAEITHINEYWHLKLSEKQLSVHFQNFEDSPPPLQYDPDKSLDMITREIKKQFTTAVRAHENDRFLKGYLLLSDLHAYITRHRLEDKIPYYGDILKHLGLYAASSSKYEKAVEYFDRYLDLNKNKIIEDTVAYEHLLATMYTENFPAFEKLISFYLSMAEAEDNINFALTCKRLKAFLTGRSDRYEEANEELKKLLKIAEKNKFHENEIAILYNIGIIYWRQEQYEKSLSYIKRSYEISKKNKLLHKNIQIFVLMVMLYNDLGQYSKVPAVEKTAEKISFSLNNQQVIAQLQSSICLSYLHLNDIHKAEQLLVQFINSSSLSEQFSWLFNYYSIAGLLALAKNRHEEAFQYYYQLKKLTKQGKSRHNIGKTYHHLLLASFYSGRISKAPMYAAKGHKEFDTIQSTGANNEIALHENLINCYYHEKPDYAGLEKIFIELFNVNSFYYASVALFHLLLQPGDYHIPVDINKNARFKSIFSDPNTAIYAVINQMYRGKLSKNQAEVLMGLKRAYNILNNAGLYFNAMLVCEAIGNLYREQSRTRHQFKFITQAHKLSKQVKNRFFIEKYKTELESIKDTINNQDQIITTYLSLSEIFQEIDNYDNSIKQILQLAVNLTAAERGALLLKKKDSDELVVKSYINCDQDSLTDIRSISLNIPVSTFAEDTPFFIENAQVDKRTREFKSIIANNILSVLCIPVKRGDTLSGVLYLDHHSIPALFSKDDLKFVTSISNFISIIIQTIDSYKNIKTINNELIETANQKGLNNRFISTDDVIKKLFSNLPNIAKSNANILLTGESGTGKEILANMIHELSSRSKMPLIKFNCAAIADTLIDSELFGIEKNTATGVDGRDGKLAAADGGTLFMDEIGDMPLAVQAKLLRVIENQEYEKVGSPHTIYTDIRFIAATNKNLAKESKNNNFRNDLYHRINTITLEIPPLRSRTNDIKLLTDYFITFFSNRKSSLIFSVDSYKMLMTYSWPGNVRELKNLVERCMILYPDEVITPEMLPREILEGQQDVDRKIMSETIEKAIIENMLRKHKGNKRKATAELGMPYTTLLRKIKKYNFTL